MKFNLAGPQNFALVVYILQTEDDTRVTSIGYRNWSRLQMTGSGLKVMFFNPTGRILYLEIQPKLNQDYSKNINKPFPNFQRNRLKAVCRSSLQPIKPKQRKVKCDKITKRGFILVFCIHGFRRTICDCCNRFEGISFFTLVCFIE